MNNTKVGMKIAKTVLVTDKMVKDFAKISTDANPIHLDDKYAESSIFKKRVAHGMLIASFISSVIGNDLPGEGTIYLKQDLNFRRPVFIDDEITILVEVIELIEEKKRLVLKTECYNQKNDLVLHGNACVQNVRIFVNKEEGK
ncbi:MAG: MaoC family dehydratase [Erysipelotrichaceae bacterium]